MKCWLTRLDCNCTIHAAVPRSDCSFCDLTFHTNRLDFPLMSPVRRWDCMNEVTLVRLPPLGTCQSLCCWFIWGPALGDWDIYITLFSFMACLPLLWDRLIPVLTVLFAVWRTWRVFYCATQPAIPGCTWLHIIFLSRWTQTECYAFEDFLVSCFFDTFAVLLCRLKLWWEVTFL